MDEGIVGAAELDGRYVNWGAELPYGLRTAEIVVAVRETYRLFHGINEFLLSKGYRPLEELILGNSLSGLISEFVVKNIARACPRLNANRKVGGYPDLLPADRYESDEVLKGSEGIEVKASIQRGGWQGHNPEECWVMIFRYVVGEQRTGGRVPLTFVEILCARLGKADWSYSGRKGDSRRTPTASITKSGVEKLRTNFLYRLPDAGIGRHRDVLADQTRDGSETAAS